MFKIKLFVRDGCRAPCERAKDYVNQAIEMLKTEGIPACMEVQNASTYDGAKAYSCYKKASGMNGFPFVVIDDEPFYAGSSKSLPCRIYRKIRGQIDSRS